MENKELNSYYLLVVVAVEVERRSRGRCEESSSTEAIVLKLLPFMTYAGSGPLMPRTAIRVLSALRLRL